MIVTRAVENNEGFVASVMFDNGLVLDSEFEPDCCAYNFLDFIQFVEGREFPTMGPEEFVKAAKAKEDGYIVVDSMGVPAWIQARSEQNGYYSANVRLIAQLDVITIVADRVDGVVED